MNELRPFFPAYTRTGPGATPAGTNLPGVIVAASNGASVASAIFQGSSNNNGLVQIQVSNKTSVWVHVNFGVFGNVTAAALTSWPVPPGTTQIASVDGEVTGATVFADGAPAGSTSVVFHRGSGIG